MSAPKWNSRARSHRFGALAEISCNEALKFGDRYTYAGQKVNSSRIAYRAWEFLPHIGSCKRLIALAIRQATHLRVT